jgi:type II secretory ATPase GspE/PulE/Tfp pilus assembly ATPase PilB-like protein
MKALPADLARYVVRSFRAAAIRHGMKTMFQDGPAKVLQGETTLDELIRVTV